MPLAALVLQVLTAVAAAWGVNRALRLQRYATDPRLNRLALFFGLFALAVAFHAVWTWQIDALMEAAREGRQVRGVRAAGIERATWALLLHHATMLLALGVAVVAFARKPSRNAAPAALGVVGLALVSDLVPVALALEAALTLYLAITATLNHLERRSPGALQVAAGFFLFFVGHAVFFVAHRPGETRAVTGDVLTLVGIVLLVQVLPGRR